MKKNSSYDFNFCLFLFLAANMKDTFLNVSDEFHSQMEKDQSQFIEFITEGVLLIIISIFGFVGNALSIYVLLRPTVKGIFSNILMGLASFDALFLICAIVTFGLPTGQLGCGVFKWKVGKLTKLWQIDIKIVDVCSVR